jgi:predicted nucleic acid-binding protein
MAIASCLVDTNILLRATRRADPQHEVATRTLGRLATQGALLYYTPQNIAELWNTMTRPAARNALGLTTAEADREVRAIETGMILLPDNEAIYREWRRIIVQYEVLGVQVHDARLAASMMVHGVTSILTFNVADFSRFTELTALHPSAIH